MLATLTSKGQVTLPKEIRDRLSLDAGAILDFQITADSTITARHVVPDARRIRGLLKSPHAAPLSVEQMDAAVSAHLRAKHSKGKPPKVKPVQAKAAPPARRKLAGR
jgi:antitoxin PrlF